MTIKSDHADRWDYMQELLEKANPKSATDKKRKYIQRTDKPEKSAHYWTVNIETPDVRYNKTFCDLKNGGKTSALLAAVGWRDKLLKDLGITILKGFKKQPFNKESKGVYYKEKSDRGYTYPYMICYWHEPRGDGKQIRKYKSFSINKYGYKKATRLAIKFRDEILRELYG